jgi:hypothetical protein
VDSKLLHTSLAGFAIRETAEWKKHAADLEMEMIKRGMIFEVKIGPKVRQSFPFRMDGTASRCRHDAARSTAFSASTTAADLLGETSSLSIQPPALDIIGSVCI